MLIRRKKKYSMSIDSAGETLSNVFAACDIKPNWVPFDEIVLRQRQNNISDNLFITIATVLFIITFLIPIFLPHSSVEVSVNPGGPGRALSVREFEITESTFSFSFDGAIVNSGACYMETSEGSIIEPLSYDRSTNTLVLPYSFTDEYNVFIYDINGRCLHLLLRPRD